MPAPQEFHDLILYLISGENAVILAWLASYQKIFQLNLIPYCQNKKIGYNQKSDTQGRVAELVDAPHSKCGDREVIGVRFSSCPFLITT
jgi:hypothetical protein